MPFPNLRTSMATALLPFMSSVVQALQRTLGDPSDSVTQSAVDSCLKKSTSSSPIGYQHGSCAFLALCVLDRMDSVASSGWQSGGAIASILPTILALFGIPSEDILQLGFTSPHRALANCIFGINLPNRLFVQLRTKNHTTDEGRRREWLVREPSTESRTASMVKTLIFDFLIVGIAAVMVWRHAVIAFQTMVTWRCEYLWLVLGWPMACAVWLIMVIILLHCIASDVVITSPDKKHRTRLDLLLLPYRRRTNSSPTPPTGSNSTSLLNSCWKVTVTMPHSYSWDWFDTISQTVAVGIYLYATFVLSSLMFLSGQQAIIYATVMVLGQSAIRVLEAL